MNKTFVASHQVIAAKTTTPNPKLPGTIYTAAAEVEAVGGKALAVQCDIRSEEVRGTRAVSKTSMLKKIPQSVQQAVDAAIKKFGKIDILINNASAINLAPTDTIEMKRYDLMHDINARGTFLCTKICLPHLRQAQNPHVLTLSPPLGGLAPKWLQMAPAYAAAKYGMSLYVMAHAGGFMVGAEARPETYSFYIS